MDTIFVVHHSVFGLPDMLFETHPCVLHVCYPKNMGEFGFVQMDEDDDSFLAHPNDKLTGVNVHSGDAELPGVNTDFDTEPTGV